MGVLSHSEEYFTYASRASIMVEGNLDQPWGNPSSPEGLSLFKHNWLSESDISQVF